MFAALILAATPSPAQPYEVLIRNARVLDGTGNDWFRADVAIAGDRIEHVGPGSPLSSKKRAADIARPGHVPPCLRYRPPATGHLLSNRNRNVRG